MTFLPGKRYYGLSGRHWRDLAADAARLRDEYQVDDLLLLVEDHELETVHVPDIVEVMAANGITVIRFPIVDVDVPTNSVRETLADVEARLADGRRVAVACMGGLGRTGTMVGCILRDGGLDGDEAIALTRATRHGTIETSRQEQFVRDYEGASERITTPSRAICPRCG